ncbi:response regulator [Paenibacillus sp. J5C_2022]|uniref:response regulator transcription factor n=1 Tax=Paenibacillus sp. J5C2022 TaxID=2977129 RepID=UPI0021D1F882|nr:response regulator [Paenibacillus sp. J5C2022]MCU6709135.1 response regulator [Paenibacillus sp. J5C2022]
MLTMLVVDDDKFEREGVKFLVDKYGLNTAIVEADSGESALAYMEQNEVDILFTDIRMREMDGLTLAEKVRDMGRQTKVIFMSAYGEFEYAKRAIHLKAVQYILKPVQVSEFVNVVTEVIRMCEEERQSRNTARLHGSSGTAPKADEGLSKAIEQVVRIVEERYASDLSLEGLAEQVYLSPNYLSHLFKKEKKISVNKYITLFRMNKAEELLRTTNRKIVDIARDVGYHNFPYFSSLFKNRFGVSPSQYREEA